MHAVLSRKWYRPLFQAISSPAFYLVSMSSGYGCSQGRFITHFWSELGIKWFVSGLFLLLYFCVSDDVLKQLQMPTPKDYKPLKSLPLTLGAVIVSQSLAALFIAVILYAFTRLFGSVQLPLLLLFVHLELCLVVAGMIAAMLLWLPSYFRGLDHNISSDARNDSHPQGR